MINFKVFIVCHTRIQYDQFIRENNLRGQERRFIHLWDPDGQLSGVEDFAIIHLDGWYHNESRFIDKVNQFEQMMIARRKKQEKHW